MCIVNTTLREWSAHGVGISHTLHKVKGDVAQPSIRSRVIIVRSEKRWPLNRHLLYLALKTSRL